MESHFLEVDIVDYEAMVDIDLKCYSEPTTITLWSDTELTCTYAEGKLTIKLLSKDPGNCHYRITVNAKTYDLPNEKSIEIPVLNGVDVSFYIRKYILLPYSIDKLRNRHYKDSDVLDKLCEQSLSSKFPKIPDMQELQSMKRQLETVDIAFWHEVFEDDAAIFNDYKDISDWVTNMIPWAKLRPLVEDPKLDEKLRMIGLNDVDIV